MIKWMRFLFALQISLLALLPQSQAGFCLKPNSKSVDSILIEKAMRLDEINEIYNRTLFKRSVVEMLEQGKGDAKGLEWIRVTRQLRALKKYLNEIPETGKTTTTKELAALVEKADKINFLFEDSVYKQLPIKDRFKFEDARKAMLYYGIEAFFKLNLKEPGILGRMSGHLSQLMNPRRIHSSEDLAYKMAWEGFEITKASIDQELASNLRINKPMRDFAVRSFVRSLFVYLIIAELILPGYDYGTAIADGYQRGKAEAMLQAEAANEAAKKVNNREFIETSTVNSRLQNSLEIFEKTKGAKASDLEIAWLEARAKGDEAKAQQIFQQLLQQNRPAEPNPAEASVGSSYKTPETVSDVSEIRWTVQSFPGTAIEPTNPEDK